MQSLPRFHFDNIYYDNPLALGPYVLRQVGDLAAGADYVCSAHLQEVLEISYCVYGTAIFTFGEDQFPIAPGELIVTPKGKLHEIRATGVSDFRYYYLALTITDLSQPVERALADYFASVPIHPVKADRCVASAFQDIFRNILNQDCFSGRLMEDAIRRVLVWTERSLQGSAEKIYLPESGAEKNRLLSQLCAYLDESVQDISALKHLPTRFGYSHSYLSSLFSRAMGISLREYFLLRRHERACRLLAEGRSVTEVAEHLGYTSIHAFSRAFSAREGTPPGKYHF